MRINIRFFYLIPILFIFFNDNLFVETLLGIGSKIPSYSLVVWIVSLVGGMYFINYMSNFMKSLCLANFIFFIYLVLESLYLYGTLFQFQNLFAKVTLIFSAFFIYGFYKKYKNKFRLLHIVAIISLFFFLNIILVNSQFLSLNYFINNSRLLTSDSALLLLLPCFYFFNGYFIKKRLRYLYLFFIVVGAIVFLQQRTVWVCTVVGLAANLILLQKSTARLNVESMTPVALLVIALTLIAIIFIFNNDDLIKKARKSTSELRQPNTPETENLRWMQLNAYSQYIYDNFLVGLRHKGIELPIQFIDVDIVTYEEDIGHHFHSFYVDRLFYFGLLGLFLVMLAPLYYIFTLVNQTKKPTREQTVLLSFVSSTVCYGFFFQIPPYAYACIGLVVYFLETQHAEEANKKDDYSNFKNQTHRVITENNITSLN